MKKEFLLNYKAKNIQEEMHTFFVWLSTHPNTFIENLKAPNSSLSALDFLLQNQKLLNKKQKEESEQIFDQFFSQILSRPDFFEKAIYCLKKGGWGVFKSFLEKMPKTWLTDDYLWTSVAEHTPSHLSSLDSFIIKNDFSFKPPFKKIFWACFKQGQSSAYWKWAKNHRDFTNQDAISLFMDLKAHIQNKEEAQQLQTLSEFWIQKGLSGYLNHSWTPLLDANRLGLSVHWIQSLTKETPIIPQEICENILDWRIRNQDVSVSFLEWFKQQTEFKWSEYSEKYPAIGHVLFENSTSQTLPILIQSFPLSIWEYVFDNKTVLYSAIEQNKLELAQILLKSGISPNHPSKSLIDLALSKQSIPMISLLLEHKADFNKPEQEWKNIQHKLQYFSKIRRIGPAFDALISRYGLEHNIPQGKNVVVRKNIQRI